MSKNPSWSEVRPRILKEIEETMNELTTAPPDRVLFLQARHAALDSVRRWFENEAKSEEKLFDQHV